MTEKLKEELKFRSLERTRKDLLKLIKRTGRTWENLTEILNAAGYKVEAKNLYHRVNYGKVVSELEKIEAILLELIID